MMIKRQAFFTDLSIEKILPRVVFPLENKRFQQKVKAHSRVFNSIMALDERECVRGRYTARAHISEKQHIRRRADTLSLLQVGVPGEAIR
jgi:hypothetical protein